MLLFKVFVAYLVYALLGAAAVIVLDPYSFATRWRNGVTEWLYRVYCGVYAATVILPIAWTAELAMRVRYYFKYGRWG